MFQEIENIPFFPKPRGGLWASPSECGKSWADWCLQENFYTEVLREENSFKFKLTPEARVLKLKTIEDWRIIEDKIPGETKEIRGFTFKQYINYEELKKDYDAVEIFAGSDHELYWKFYGWDCDSIVILNKEVIVPLE